MNNLFNNQLRVRITQKLYLNHQLCISPLSLDQASLINIEIAKSQMNEEQSPALIRERQLKHKKVMRMIHSYRPLPADIKALDKLRNTTIMEISLRYMNSTHNQTYKFPLRPISLSSDDQDEQQPHSQNQLYDLLAQEPIFKKAASTKNLDGNILKRRVKSLEKERIQSVGSRLGRDFRRQAVVLGKQSRQNSQKQFTVKGSRSTHKHVASALKLPQVSKKNSLKKIDIAEVMGKKMRTQGQQISPDHRPGQQYVLKYLTPNLKAKPKKFFLQAT